MVITCHSIKIEFQAHKKDCFELGPCSEGKVALMYSTVEKEGESSGSSLGSTASMAASTSAGNDTITEEFEESGA